MTDPRDAILTTPCMGDADRYAMSQGRSGGSLMAAAGQGVVDAVLRRFAPRPTAVLCGPGNNGGDGWEVAVRLEKLGWPVSVYALAGRDMLTGDSAAAAARWRGPVFTLSDYMPANVDLVVDALFGAGLTRPLDGEAERLARACSDASAVVAVDVPSGLDGTLARAEGAVFQADLTITFHRLKPAHLLQPGRALCAEVVLADIGIPDGWQEAAPPSAQINHPGLWPLADIAPGGISHKHSRGRLSVLAGPAGATGAARLSARAGLVGGAGFVTLLTTPGLLHDLSLAEPSLVTRRYGRFEAFADALQDHRADAAVLGPGAGVTDRLKEQVLSALSLNIALVLDADALTAFESSPPGLFDALHPKAVLTPHAGEFARLFPDLASSTDLNKIEKTRQAAQRAGCTILFKGADTVIASPDGRVRVNVHASPHLATAGTGDVLAGLIGAFAAQGLPPFEAASAGAWIQGDAGRRCGPGATVFNVLDKLPAALSHACDVQHRAAARQRVYVAGG